MYITSELPLISFLKRTENKKKEKDGGGMRKRGLSAIQIYKWEYV